LAFAFIFFFQGIQAAFFRHTYEIWDLVPRNILVDAEGDIFVVDAEMKHKQHT
jgi:hypothetical protein